MLAYGSPLNLALYPFNMTPLFCEHFLTFQNHKTFQTCPVLSVPRPGIGHFSEGLWSLYSGMVLGNQDIYLHMCDINVHIASFFECCEFFTFYFLTDFVNLLVFSFTFFSCPILGSFSDQYYLVKSRWDI